MLFCNGLCGRPFSLHRKYVYVHVYDLSLRDCREQAAAAATATRRRGGEDVISTSPSTAAAVFAATASGWIWLHDQEGDDYDRISRCVFFVTVFNVVEAEEPARRKGEAGAAAANESQRQRHNMYRGKHD